MNSRVRQPFPRLKRGEGYEREGGPMVKKTLIGLMVASAATLALAAPASAEEARWGLTQEGEPGGLVPAQTFTRNDCGLSPVTSKGFTAPLQWTEGGNYGVIR